MRRRPWHRRFRVPPFGLRRRIFWSLLGATLTAGLLTMGLFRLWSKISASSPGGGGTIFVLALCAWLSLWIASGLLARRLVRPLNRLVDAVERFGQGDYSARTGFPAKSRDEVGRVAGAIDEMAGRLERQMREEQQLLAVVSHELRTPLARIRVLTDLAREGQASSLEDIDREISEIDYLVSNILARSRLEFGSLDKKPLRLMEAAAEALERAGLDASLLEAPGGEPDPPILADPTLLHRAIANLIDNAQRYGKGVERIEVQADGRNASIEVLDRGPGFAPDSSGSRSQGLGIGLKLVRQIVASHGGRVWTENRPGGGARVGFQLPIGSGGVREN